MPRQRIQNNARLVAAITAGLLLVFLVAELVLRKSQDFQTEFLASAVLFGLTVLNFSLLLVLVFVLGRNLVRMLMEWRRGVFGARLRVHPMYLKGLEKAIGKPELFEEFQATGRELIEPELAEILRRRGTENGPAVTLNDLRACDEFDIMDRLGEIRVPTLAICGSDDIMTPPMRTERR